MLNSFPICTFPILADTFESQCPEWLDENYYGKQSIMTAICARMIARKHKPVQHIAALNQLYNNILSLSRAATGRFMIAGMTVIVWNRDNTSQPDSQYELIVYG